MRHPRDKTGDVPGRTLYVRCQGRGYRDLPEVPGICPLVTLLKETPEAYRAQYDLAVKSITHLVGHLTPAELDAICRIEEPETEKVAEVPRGDF